MNKVKWIFFDIGSTLVDERVAYKNRIKKTIANTDISYNDFFQRMEKIAKYDQNAYNRAVETFGLKKAPWNSNDEYAYPEAENILKELRQPLKIQFLFLNIILNSKSEKTYRNITFYIIINIVLSYARLLRLMMEYLQML